MAKLSSINKNERRKRLVKKYANKYAKLKAVAEDETRDESERLIARLKQAELPRNANPTRVRNRCAVTGRPRARSEEHTSELQSLMRISYDVFCLKKKKKHKANKDYTT